MSIDKELLESVKGKSREERKAFFLAHKAELLDDEISMLEEENPFIEHYDDTADSLITASLPLGVPYYYAGRTEEKFLNRYYPQTITNYYRPDHMYFCGLDCVGMTRLVYEKSNMERHPSIIAMLARGIGSSALKSRDPAEWVSLFLPGELFCVLFEQAVGQLGYFVLCFGCLVGMFHAHGDDHLVFPQWDGVDDR